MLRRCPGCCQFGSDGFNNDSLGCELNPGLSEGRLDFSVGDAPQRPLIARFCRKFAPHNKRGVIHAVDALGFQGLEELRSVFRVFQQFLADFLNQLAYFFHIFFKRDTQFKLHDDPVTAEVGQCIYLTIRNGMDWPIVVSQLH